jgi:hypothetical protein
VGIAFALPEGTPSAPFGLVPILALRAIAQSRQRALVDAHVAAGGKRASTWAAAGIGVASLTAILVPVFVVAIIVGILSST